MAIQTLTKKAVMSSSSDIFDKIRIKPRKARQAEEEARKAAQCNWEGCEEPGAHKAPMGRNREGAYLNFCLEHVRLYNKNYNYFSGLNDDEIAKFQKENITGHRPTWSMGSKKKPTAPVDESILRATPTWHGQVRNKFGPDGKRKNDQSGRKLRRLEAKALMDLGLGEMASAAEIKTQYKLLVKQNHPDANGGDRSSEDRLRQIIQAYKHLKQAGFC